MWPFNLPKKKKDSKIRQLIAETVHIAHINTYTEINESSSANKATCMRGINAPIATLSTIKFFDNSEQFTASPRAIRFKILPGWIDFTTGNGSLKLKQKINCEPSICTPKNPTYTKTATKYLHKLTKRRSNCKARGNGSSLNTSSGTLTRSVIVCSSPVSFVLQKRPLKYSCKLPNNCACNCVHAVLWLSPCAPPPRTYNDYAYRPPFSQKNSNHKRVRLTCCNNCKHFPACRTSWSSVESTNDMINFSMDPFDEPHGPAYVIMANSRNFSAA